MLKRLNNHSTFLLSVVFFIGIYFYGVNLLNFNLMEWVRKIGTVQLLAAFVFYLISHFMRGLRLAVMVGNSTISLRTIILTQYLTNGVNLILPFKLGELIRLYEVHKIVNKYKVSFSAIIAEKSIDFCFLFLGLFIVCLVSGNVVQYINYTLYVCGAVVLFLLLLFIVLPGNIKSFNLFLAKRYTGIKIVSILSITSKVYTIISVIKELLNQRFATIALLTSVIWFFEVAAFLYVYPFIMSYKVLIMLALLVFVSDFIPTGSLSLGGLQLAFYLIYLMVPGFAFLQLSFIYQIFVFFPAMVLSWLIFLFQRILPKNSSIYKMEPQYVSANRNTINFRSWINKMFSFFKV